MPAKIVAHVPPELRKALVPIDDVRPLERNARRGNVEVVRESLRTHGQFKPILVRRETSEVLAGNHTRQAALEEGWTHIAVLYRSVPSDEDARRIALVDNRTSDLAEWDIPVLAAELQALPDWTGTGYDQAGVDAVLAQAEQLLADAADAVKDPEPPPPPRRPVTKPGDVIELGRHRLVCGDAREASVWTALMADRDPVQAVWTDPPYGIDLAANAPAGKGAEHVKTGIKRHGSIIGDGAGDDASLALLLEAVFAACHDCSTDSAALYVCHADQKRGLTVGALEAAGWRHSQTLIWVKDRLVLGRMHYQWRHEPIIYAGKQGQQRPAWHGGRDKTTVLEVPRPHRAELHPTSKPVALVVPMLRNSTTTGATVLDPFAGSGSTALACEQTDRACLMIEIDPGYADVVVMRWEELTGQKAKRPGRARRKAAA